MARWCSLVALATPPGRARGTAAVTDRCRYASIPGRRARPIRPSPVLPAHRVRAGPPPVVGVWRPRHQRAPTGVRRLLHPDAVPVVSRARRCARNRPDCRCRAASRSRWRSPRSSRRRRTRASCGPPAAAQQPHDRRLVRQPRRTEAGRSPLRPAASAPGASPALMHRPRQGSHRKLGQGDRGDDGLAREAGRVVDAFEKDQSARIQ